MICRHMSILVINLITIALFTPVNAAESSSSTDSPSKAVAVDSILSMSITISDHTPMSERSSKSIGLNRCFATVTVRNVSTKKARFPGGYAQFNWSMEGSPLANDYTVSAGLINTYHPVALSAFGTLMTKVRQLRSVEAGIEAGQEEVFEVDLGRMFDLSLSQRYFLSGKLGYEVDGVPAELIINRVAVIVEENKK